MSESDLLIQGTDKPIFKDIYWSRPENKSLAGKLLIIGGNSQSFSDVALTFNQAVKAGAGSIKVVLPDSLKQVVGKTLDNTLYCPSTPSGSFSKDSLNDWLQYANWADMVLLAGGFGRNSETAILIEEFTNKYRGWVCLTNDALDFFTPSPIKLLSRANTLVVPTVAILQKYSIKLIPNNVIKFEMDLIQLATSLQELSKLTEALIVSKHLDKILVAAKGNISSTKISTKFDPWREYVAAYGSVWLMQNQNKPFEALTTSIFDMHS